MSKKARTRKATRRRWESWWKSRHYRGVADMMKDFYDMKGKEYRPLEDGIVFKTDSKIWRLQNHHQFVNGIAVWGVGRDLKPSRLSFTRYLDSKNVDYIYKRAREELFKLWKESNLQSARM